MYSGLGLGQQTPILQRTNPDGSVTYYFGPIAETVVEQFPEAATATVIPEATRQAIAASARPIAAAAGLPGWVLPVALGAGLLLLVRR